MTTAASLGQNTRLLHFTIKLAQRDLKRTVGIYNNLTHLRYQRDLPASECWAPRG